MTKYLNEKFSVNYGGKAYGDNWDKIFGQGESGMSKSISDQVREFHQAFGMPVNTVPAVPPGDRVQLRLRLITEEYCELLESCGPLSKYLKELLFAYCDSVEPKDVDLVEFTDACADLDYVVEGARLEFGVDSAPVAAEVHRSNMSKVGPGGKVTYREDGKVVKPETYSPADIAGELKKQGWNAD